MKVITFRKALVCGLIVSFAGAAFFSTAYGDPNREFMRDTWKQNYEINVPTDRVKNILENKDASWRNDEDQMLIDVNTGKDIITYIGQPTLFKWYAICPSGDEIEYKWDFDGDGIFDFSKSGHAGQILQSNYIYDTKGIYNATLKVTLPYDSISPFYDYVKVTVETGSSRQTYVEESKKEIGFPELLPADSVTETYAVMINGGYETRFWRDVDFTYHMLIEDYGYTPDQIYLFNHDGTNPDGENPNNMIDFAAVDSNIAQVFTILASIIDEDDFLFVWSTDHGGGYYGHGTTYYGFSYSKPEVDPGDESDYLESEFKLRSFFTSYPNPCNHGMGVWKYRESGDYAYRGKFVSTFEDVYFLDEDTVCSNNDIWIEAFQDYLAGDFNAKGVEVFDEDDWGEINYYYQVYDSSGGYWLLDAVFFDPNLDNSDVCIDVNYAGGVPEIDGCDLDNQGLFNGIDINDDGDMDDWVSIDEYIYLSGDLYDDELRSYMVPLNPQVTVVFLEPCFSGGFIWDLSAPNRVICTATVEEDVFWGNYFVRGFTSAFHGEDEEGNPVDADYNEDGNISMVEAFNYAAVSDPTSEIPQYDDNGDGISHNYPIPNGGDGNLGSLTFLTGIVFIRGDADADGVINSADVVYLINYLFKGGPAPMPLEAGDVNCDEIINSADVVYLINYLFKGGPPPSC